MGGTLPAYIYTHTPIHTSLATRSRRSCVPAETDGLRAILEARGLVGSSTPVNPCKLGKRTDGVQAVELNLQWFVVQQMRETLHSPPPPSPSVPTSLPG